jgi:hypothetical protein
VGGAAAGPVGGVAARLDQGDLDAELGDLLGQGFAEGLQRLFGGVVQAHGQEGEHAADAGDLQQVAAALRTQVGEGGLGDPQRADQVGLDLARACCSLGSSTVPNRP